MKLNSSTKFLITFIIILLIIFGIVIFNKEALEKAASQNILGPNPFAPHGVRFINDDLKRNEALIKKMQDEKR